VSQSSVGTEAERTSLARALEFRYPGLVGVVVGPVIQAQKQLVGDLGSLPPGKGEGVREQAGGRVCHGVEYSRGS